RSMLVGAGAFHDSIPRSGALAPAVFTPQPPTLYYFHPLSRLSEGASAILSAASQGSGQQSAVRLLAARFPPSRTGLLTAATPASGYPAAGSRVPSGRVPPALGEDMRAGRPRSQGLTA